MRRTDPTLFTIGHGTAQIDAFIASLRRFDVANVVDVRRFAGSKRNPQFGAEALARSLREAEIAYRNEVDLGGRRRAEKASHNTGLRNEAFRAYADYMETAEFRRAFDALVDEAAASRTAIMCSETVWWRCHRRLIADAAVLLRETPVRHIIGDAAKPHLLTGGVRVEEGLLRYLPVDV